MDETAMTKDRRDARASGVSRAGRGPGPTALLKAALIALFGLVHPATAETLRGSALMRERIALPPDAVFEAVIEDTSRADAPSRER